MKTKIFTILFWIFGAFFLFSYTFFSSGCASKPVSQKIVNIKLNSEIPVKISVYRSCDGNWNFCRWQ